MAIWSGEGQVSLGAQALMNLGLSAENAEMVYGLAVAGLEVAAIRQLIDNPSQIRVTYQAYESAPKGAVPSVEYQQQLKDLFDSSSARDGITIGDTTYLSDVSKGVTRAFDGVSEAQVKTYFEDMTGQSLSSMKTLTTPKGTIYVAETPAGNFNLRDFDTSGTGAKWTIDVTRGVLGNTEKWELKFK